VGRFSRRGTRKCQLEMVRAFARAHPALPTGWEYVCLGGLAADADDRSYFEEVREAAEGHPIRLLANPSDQVIREAYERASVFWHAAGYGEDEEAHPERTEHFGMSTVEAMAAGCVPVVIRKGGQPEIVEHGSSGFLWETPEELVTHTRRLLEARELRERMAQAARHRARTFTNFEAFSATMLRMVE
jgi:glycosyltransferase involved in cell wall biosynthesis